MAPLHAVLATFLLLQSVAYAANLAQSLNRHKHHRHVHSRHSHRADGELLAGRFRLESSLTPSSHSFVEKPLKGSIDDSGEVLTPQYYPGAFGKVFVAKEILDEKTTRPVAIKFFATDLDFFSVGDFAQKDQILPHYYSHTGLESNELKPTSSTGFEAFKNELRYLAQLDASSDDFVVKLYGVIWVEGTPNTCFGAPSSSETLDKAQNIWYDTLSDYTQKSGCKGDDAQYEDIRALVFEYCAKGNLEKYIRSLPPYGKQKMTDYQMRQTLGYAYNIIDAVKYLHDPHGANMGFMHGDIRPANLLICSSDSGEDRVKLSDFEFAHDGSYVPARPGSDEYAAPEYFLWSFSRTSVDSAFGDPFQTDLFATGLTLNELLNDALLPYSRIVLSWQWGTRVPRVPAKLKWMPFDVTRASVPVAHPSTEFVWVGLDQNTEGMQKAAYSKLIDVCEKEITPRVPQDPKATANPKDASELLGQSYEPSNEQLKNALSILKFQIIPDWLRCDIEWTGLFRVAGNKLGDPQNPRMTPAAAVAKLTGVTPLPAIPKPDPVPEPKKKEGFWAKYFGIGKL